MAGRRRLARDDIDAHLVWLRDALGDETVRPRLLIGGILDVLDALAEALPGPPAAGPGPPAGEEPP